MLYRKIEATLKAYFTADSNKVLIIDGARQVSKSFIIRHVGEQMFENYIEVNLLEDANGARFFEAARQKPGAKKKRLESAQH